MLSESVSYRLSRWCKQFVHGEIMALLHTLSLAVIFLPKEIGEKLVAYRLPTDESILVSELGEGVMAPLIEEGLMVPASEDEMIGLLNLRNRLASNIHLELMYLLVTDGCNFRCRYCFEDTPDAPNFKAAAMDEMTTTKALELFSRLTSLYGRKGAKRIIHLYGGEPLLNPKAVRTAIVKVGELKETGTMPSECQIVIVTNGALLDESWARFFAKHNVTVGISLDGPRGINNIHRLAKNKKVDAFEVAKKAYEIARKHELTVGLSVTMTPEVVQNFDDVLDFFINDLRIKDGLGFNLLYFNPAVPLTPEHFELTAKCLIRAFERFRELGIYEEKMMRKTKAFVNQEAVFADCGVVGNQIVVSPDGRIGVCQDFVKPRTYFAGSVFDDNYDPIKDGLFAGWSNRSPLFMDKCLDCEALGICGGGCPASAELRTGSRWNIDDCICPHSKLALEWLIWDTYANLAI